MSNETFKFKKRGEYEITQRKGLDEKAPVQIQIIGNIDSVTNWLEKRVVPHNPFNPEDKTTSISDMNQTTDQPDTQADEKTDVIRFRAAMELKSLMNKLSTPDSDNMVNQFEAHVLINRDDLKISLIFNESDPFYCGYITGQLAEHPDFYKWKINTGNEWTSKGLSEFIKMNRSCFSDKNDAMRLSAELANLKVKVDKEVERANDNRANIREMVSQNVIEMNIPKSFKLVIPVFKGQPAQTFEVEIYVNANNFQVTLVSPDVNDLIAAVRDSIIDEQKSKIESLAPYIAIIEQ